MTENNIVGQKRVSEAEKYSEVYVILVKLKCMFYRKPTLSVCFCVCELYTAETKCTSRNIIKVAPQVD